jgi:hypothetical protein
LGDAHDEREGLADDLSPRHPQNAEAGGLQIGVAGAVAFERRSRRVERVTVDLDDEPAVPPQQIDLMPGLCGH